MPIDHLTYAVPDLARGVARIREMLHVDPTPGGRHDGLGTANALVGLGGDCYLEIIGPDPAQPDPPQARPFGIDRLREPRLVTWCMRTSDLDQLLSGAASRGYDPGSIIAMSRERPDGQRLAWRLLVRDGVLRGGALPGDGLIPFAIDWGTTPHPAAALTHGCRLIELHGRHPQPDPVRAGLAALDVSLAVEEGSVPSLAAVIDSPAGRVTLT